MIEIFFETRIPCPCNGRPPSIINHFNKNTKIRSYALFCKECDMLERSYSPDDAAARWDAQASARLRSALLLCGPKWLIHAPKAPRL